MQRKIEAYVEEILGAIRSIKFFIKNIDFVHYTQDDKTKAAVERKLLTIGEALNQMSVVDSEIEKRILDFRKIVGFRNILVHGYFGIDDGLVWDVITKKIDQLKADVEKL